ncbi:MAG TPA: iron-sulfur cluster assembly accessory protein [Phycisphaerae bacterium]|nr:iron-sulfur cluster assembly accessory protein [Phycisphaerae bacterium]
MITLTEKAAQQVLQIIEQHRQDEAGQSGSEGEGGGATATEAKPMYLRVGVVGGGCSGFKQTLDLTETLGENDEVFEQHGVKVICDAKSHIYLDGATIDFKSTTMGSGFAFEIPSATGRCGCGQSFSV